MFKQITIIINERGAGGDPLKSMHVLVLAKSRTLLVLKLLTSLTDRQT